MMTADCRKKEPGYTTGALTTLTSQDRCVPDNSNCPLPLDVATAGHAKAAVRQSANIGQRDPQYAVGYLIASLFPGAAAFLTSLSSRTPFSYVASHADSSSSTGSVKLR